MPPLDTSTVELAQAAPPPRSDVLPIDLTPVKLPERGYAFRSFQSSILYHLPARLFVNASVENSIRLETNIFARNHDGKADGIYRVLPNVTMGYALTRRTRVSSNYFFFEDAYFNNGRRLTRNIHSVGMRLDQDFPIGDKTVLTTSFFTRELFITGAQALNDLLPSAVLVRRVGQKGIVYASVVGQIRFREVLKRYQEFDQFYTIGGAYRTNPWVFSGDFTAITNFGKRRLRGGGNNQLFILTMEAGRQIHPKLPLTAFVRAEPIWQTGASGSQGFAGFNFRLFGGVRAEVSKPAIFPVKVRTGS